VTATASSQSDPGSSGIPNHHLQIQYGSGWAQIGKDTIFNGARTVHCSFSMPASMVGAITELRYNAPHDLAGPWLPPNYLDLQVVNAARIRYARTGVMNGLSEAIMVVPSDGSSPYARWDVSGMGGTPVVYAHGDTVRRIRPTSAGGFWPVVFPQAPGPDGTRTHVFAEESVQAITALRPVTASGYFTDFGALDTDSALLIVTHSSLLDGAQQYAAYRSAESPNRYSTLVVDVDELYDQFGAGVPKHAGSIRSFCAYLLSAWSTKPRGLFLIGKSVNSWNGFPSNSPSFRPDAGGAYARTLVPSYGFPSSDQCFTSGLQFDARRMDIPVGRLSANTNNDVLAYLAKVRATESKPPGIWQKNVLHFAGGLDAGQIEALAATLAGLGAIASDSLWGAHVVPFKKETSAVIGQASAEEVRHYIEDEGVTLMTFLAHAFSSSFDITIDEPQNYDWHGKYPMLIGNSCYIGDVHLNGAIAASERWTVQPNAGTIAFLAAAKQGLVGLLTSFTGPYYESFSRLNYGASIGEHMQYAGYRAQQLDPSIAMMWNVQNFVLQGDPTLRLNQHPLPDYAVSDARILFEPANVSADLDTFTVKVVVDNIGKAVNRDAVVELRRSNASLGPAPIPYFATLSGIRLRDTAVFRVPTRGFSGGQGINQFQVRVDLEPDLVDELDDIGNNVANATLFITSGDLVPCYPYDFAIVPEVPQVLKASTGDPLAPVRTYVFQIDTTDTFDSPVLETHTLQAPGGVVSWQPQSIYAVSAGRDSVVYFWRCSIDSASSGNNAYNWYERSFQHIGGKRGWGQAHVFQFKDDGYLGVLLDRPSRSFAFEQGMRTLRVNTQGNVGGYTTGWFMELQPQDYGGCGPAAWHVSVVDGNAFEPWGTYWVNPSTGQVYNPDHQFGNYNNNGTCRPRYELYFNFWQNSAPQLTGMQNMLQNAIPDGDHVMLYTWLYLNKDGMEANRPELMTYLEGLGVPLSTMPDSVPYICYYRKGDPTSFRDTIGASITDIINLSVTVPTAFGLGRIDTRRIGPAERWDALYWDERPATASDSTRIKVYGVPHGTDARVQLFDLQSPLDSVPDLGALVDARDYPELVLRAELFDPASAEPVPAQMQRWQVLHAPLPECAIHPPLAYYNALDGLQEGQDAAVAVAVQNISPFDMDSLLIGATVIDRGNIAHQVHYKVNAPLPAGGWVADTIRFSTLGFGGANVLRIEANPLDTATGAYHQREQYHFNNVALLRFDVQRDIENPILDVTFDGVRILDGDIVSAKPEILISLDDENTVRLLDSPGDTASFMVFLKRPGGEQRRIWFRDAQGNEVLRFTPASGAENIARIHYRPRFEDDGPYELTVRASDLARNQSGNMDYRVRFEVMNRATITNVMNYPNPFTTSTRFVFSLTGDRLPTYMKVQIMTITGKVVREVMMDELGPLRVGRNITEFAWDGTDEFGDRLARGVYLYRVIARLNDEDIEVRETGASSYFTKGVGKMYLMR
jgi:hypothetical protein